MEVMYVSYDEAQKLIPFFQVASQDKTYGAEAMESARRILAELRLVRGDITYHTPKGRQIILRNERDKEFLIDTIAALGVR